MVQDSDWAHSHGGGSPGEEATNTRKDSWEAAEGPEGETKVFVQSSTESLDKNAGMLPFIVASFFLSVIFPPLGCIAFCMSLNAPSGSSRAVWGERALGLGGLLSFLYTLLLAMLLSEFYFIPESAITGYGY
ncbi:hypothetical protein Efla_002917 [Eimeria flavescens]